MPIISDLNALCRHERSAAGPPQFARERILFRTGTPKDQPMTILTWLLPDL